jgi:hypothetical protein
LLIFAARKVLKKIRPTFAKASVNKSGSSSFGRARPCQGRGGRFEPGLPLSEIPFFQGGIFCLYTLVAEQVDAQDLKSCLQKCGYGFDSRLGYFFTFLP